MGLPPSLTWGNVTGDQPTIVRFFLFTGLSMEKTIELLREELEAARRKLNRVNLSEHERAGTAGYIKGMLVSIYLVNKEQANGE